MDEIKTTMPESPSPMAHPIVGADYTDDDGIAQLVQCPDCSQMEWWSANEVLDHGKCRTLPIDGCDAC